MFLLDRQRYDWMIENNGDVRGAVDVFGIRRWENLGHLQAFGGYEIQLDAIGGRGAVQGRCRAGEDTLV